MVDASNALLVLTIPSARDARYGTVTDQICPDGKELYLIVIIDSVDGKIVIRYPYVDVLDIGGAVGINTNAKILIEYITNVFAK